MELYEEYSGRSIKNYPFSVDGGSYSDPYSNPSNDAKRPVDKSGIKAANGPDPDAAAGKMDGRLNFRNGSFARSSYQNHAEPGRTSIKHENRKGNHTHREYVLSNGRTEMENDNNTGHISISKFSLESKSDLDFIKYHLQKGTVLIIDTEKYFTRYEDNIMLLKETFDELDRLARQFGGWIARIDDYLLVVNPIKKIKF